MSNNYTAILVVFLFAVSLPGCGESTDDSPETTDNTADVIIVPESTDSDFEQDQEITEDSLGNESFEAMSRTGGIEPLDTLGIGDPPQPEPTGVGGDGGGQSDKIPPGDRPR